MSGDFVLPRKVSGPAVELLLSCAALKIAVAFRSLPPDRKEEMEADLQRGLAHARTHTGLSELDRQQFDRLSVYFQAQLTSHVMDDLFPDGEEQG